MGVAAVRARRAALGEREHSHAIAVAAVVVALALAAGWAVAAIGLDMLVLCVSLAVCAVLLFEYRIGVVLLIVLMPLSGSALFPHAMLGVTGLNPLNLLLVATLGSLIVHRLHERKMDRAVPRPLWWLYIVPLLVAGAIGSRHVGEIVPGFYANNMIAFFDVPGYLRDMVIKPLLMVVYAVLVAAAVTRSQRPQWLLLPALVSIWVMSGMAVVFVLTGGMSLGQLAGSDQREFLSPLGMHANELGRLYTFAYALLLFGWAEARSAVLRPVLAASLALVVVALLLTFSRSAFVGQIIVSALFLLWRRRSAAPILLGLLVLAAVFALPTVFFERLTTGFGGGLNAISAGRIEGLWLPLLRDVASSPLYGHGLGSILWSQAMRQGGGGAVLGVTHPHSAYLQTLLDMGVLGLALLGAYFVHVWARLRRLAADAQLVPELRGFFTGACAGLLSLLIVALVDSSLTPKPEHALLWLAIGIAYGLQARRASQR